MQPCAFIHVASYFHTAESMYAHAYRSTGFDSGCSSLGWMVWAIDTATLRFHVFGSCFLAMLLKVIFD